MQSARKDECCSESSRRKDGVDVCNVRGAESQSLHWNFLIWRGHDGITWACQKQEQADFAIHVTEIIIIIFWLRQTRRVFYNLILWGRDRDSFSSALSLMSLRDHGWLYAYAQYSGYLPKGESCQSFNSYLPTDFRFLWLGVPQCSPMSYLQASPTLLVLEHLRRY